VKKVIVIVGATGSGKTKLAIDIAKKYNGEIINADAFQVYKEISVGTAKANKEETKQVKFHLNGELSIYEPWDIAIFQERAKKIIDELIKNKKVPIIVGGSNLYIDALIYNYDLSAPARDEQYENFTTPDLYDKLIKLDKNVASTIDAHNRRRIIRALQIISNNGAFRKKNKPLYEPLIIYKEMPRELVYEKINNNVEKMIKNG
jgi:tRNA dimethylallyltransferase